MGGKFKKQRGRAGFVLLEMTVVAVIIAVVIIFTTNAAMRFIQRQKVTETQEKLAFIQATILNVIAQNGYLPYPALPTLSPDSSTYGVENAGTVTTNGGTIYYGTIPTQTLKIPSSYMFDSWGDKISYYVSANSSKTNFAKANDVLVIKDQTTGITEPAGTFAILSHGKDGAGSYNRTGTQDTRTSTALETNNAYATSKTINTTNPLIIDKNGAVGDIGLAMGYNDIVLTLTRLGTGLDTSKIRYAEAGWLGGSDPTIPGNVSPSVPTVVSVDNSVTPPTSVTGMTQWDSANGGFRLTNTTESRTGALIWQFPQSPNMKVTFSFKAGGSTSTGADATWFFCYSNQYPSTEEGQGIANGYIFAFSEWRDQIELRYGNMGATNVLTSSALSDIDNGSEHSVIITISGSNIKISYDGTQIIDYTDATTRNKAGQYFGFGARTGGSTNNHWITKFQVLPM